MDAAIGRLSEPPGCRPRSPAIGRWQTPRRMAGGLVYRESTCRRPPPTHPSSILIVVFLPEPFGPRKPYTEPLGTARSRWSTASWPPRNRLVSPLVEIAVKGRWLRGRGGARRRRGLARGGVQDAGLDRAGERAAAVGHQHRDQAGVQQPAGTPGAVLDGGRPDQRAQRRGALTRRAVRGDRAWPGRTGGQRGGRQLEDG